MSASYDPLVSGLSVAYNPLDEVPSSLEDIQDFLDTEELTKPLMFAKTPNFTNFLHFGAWIGAALSMGVSCLCPVILFKPEEVVKHFSLKLDADSLTFNSAFNDCCFHVAVSQQTIPLDKIQDVQLQSGCLQTMFHLKDVRVQTAGVNQSGTPDVSTAFLAYPEKAREAIQLAVKLYKKRTMGQPRQEGAMRRGGGDMHERLQRLAKLVQTGVLTGSEADAIRVKVLAAEQDLTLRLTSAEALFLQGLLSQEEFDEVRVALVAQL